LIVGGFPPPNSNIVFGGVISSCKALASSTLSERFNLVLLDSTQITNPPPGLLIRLPLALRRLFKFCFQLWRMRPDIVLVFTSGGSSLLEKGLMSKVAVLWGKPALIFPRSGIIMNQFPHSLIHRILIKLTLRNSTKLLCQGDAWHSFAVRELKYDVSDAPIVHNWTATKDLLEIGENKINESPNKRVRFLFLGWLEEKKGIFELLDACLHLKDKLSFRLVIAGKGQAELKAQEFVKKNKLSEFVKFAGWVDGVELETLFKNSDVLVLPSWAEGLPNAMIEAMAAGLAVVVSSVGNIPSVLTDGKNGLLIPPKNVKALTKALHTIIDDPILLNSLAVNGHNLARESFSIDQGVRKLESIFNEFRE
jgi:glycosyltransferase involved in cell wall biosynthesis